ncbi:hypothetical protein F5Y13DRAFT_173316 [Hypoxylon sp. FL1857]|nr:hypothetical protein F5Y13DRAFT_173316 [Hypoxylon sp. FL1857]
MAEPVGLLGTVVGVVSLGIQVYGGLKKYLDDYRSREKHVSKTLDRLEQLQLSLENIKAIIPSIENGCRKPADTVMSSLLAAQAELQILHDKLKENEPSSPADLKGKMKETRKKLAFPFRISDLDKLESALEKIVGTLSIAMQGLGLNIASVIDAKVANIDDTVTTMSPKLDALATNVRAIRVEQTATAIREVDAQSTLSSRIQSIEYSTSRTMEQVERIGPATQSSHSEILKMLQAIQLTLKDRGGSFDNAVSERAFTGMMVAKPALLREASDGANLGSTTPSSSSAGSPQDIVQQGSTTAANQFQQAFFSCSCRCRRRVDRKSSHWSSFYTIEEIITESKHQPGCLFFQPETREHHRSFGVLVTGLHRYLSTAVSMSLCITHGAGGRSISPTIQHFAMVDRSKSPAFRIIRDLARVLDEKTKNGTWNEALRRGCRTADLIDTNELDLSSLKISNYQDILCIGISRLRRVFSSGAALPTDVDISGKSAIYYALLVSPRSLALNRGMDALHELYGLLRALLELGIPCDTPAQLTANSIIYRCLREEIIDIILPTRERRFISEDITMNLLFRSTSRDTTMGVFDIIQYRESVAELEPLAEALGLDSPIHTALLRRTENNLRRILQDPSTGPLTQRTNGVTVTHIAIGWPVGLEILLKAVPDLDINSQYYGESPLLLAARYSAWACPERFCLGDELCNDCACAESVKILLDAGCHFSRYDVGRILASGSGRACSTVLEHIKMWRDNLKSLLFDHIPEVKFSGRYDSSVLDAKTNEVITMLERKGIFPFQKYSLQPDDYRLSGRRYANGSPSIYHEISTLNVAKEAFKLGFRDLDVAFKGRTPLMEFARTTANYWRTPYIYWLVARGAICTTVIPYKSAHKIKVTMDANVLPIRTVLHGISRTLGNGVCWDLRRGGLQSKMRFDCPRIIWKSTIGDGCKCGCSRSPDGCYFITGFLGSFFRDLAYHRGLSDLNCSYDEVVIWVSELLNPIVKKAELDVLTEATIRAFTFNYLDHSQEPMHGTELCGLRHTCCISLWDLSLPTEPSLSELESYGEDHEELRDEDHDLLCKLDELVLEFTEEFSREAYSFPEFIKDHWLPRMAHVVDELESEFDSELEDSPCQEIMSEIRWHKDST